MPQFCLFFIDHARSGARYIISRAFCLCVCLYVCQPITFESHDVRSSFSHIQYISRECGQVFIWRSSDQGQGHRSQNVEKFLVPQCKTSIDNNSVSITHRVVKFAFSMGFLAMADRMMWPPSLSRDRKWPHVTKCRLEGNLIYINSLFTTLRTYACFSCYNFSCSSCILPACQYTNMTLMAKNWNW